MDGGASELLAINISSSHVTPHGSVATIAGMVGQSGAGEK
jgi:hypothetical protein